MWPVEECQDRNRWRGDTMKSIRTLLLMSFCLTLSDICPAQIDQFDWTKYQQFLEQNRNMVTSELLQMYPTGDFKEDVNIPWESVLHSDLIEAKYTLTDHEKLLLRRHGFVVTERLRKDSFIDQLQEIWRQDLPLFISTDAILHAFHVYYDRILVQVELSILANHLTVLLSELHGKLPDLAAKYSSETAMDQMLRDVDVYLTVPRILLGQNVSPYYEDNTAEINRILDLIDAGQYTVYPFFSESCKEIDFSQFIPRGHYTKHVELEKYFRAIMWLGRIEIYLLPPQTFPVECPVQTPADIQRQTIDAVLILELMDLAGANSLYDEMESILSFLVGEQDNVTPPNLKSVVESISLQDASQLLNAAMLQNFQDTLQTRAFAFQRILSQILRHDPYRPDDVQPASVFVLFGQRFVIDSYITGNVVYDKIIHDNDFVCRLFPSTLDILFALGNDAAAQLLIPQLDEYHYSTNLAALRYLIDSHDAAFWDSSTYNIWLDSIRALNPPIETETLPQFMQTQAWWHQKMNTQLASWTELRHDNVLYAKQSYTAGGPVCSYPDVYVEPIPALYQRLSELAAIAHSKFADVSFPDDGQRINILDYLDMLENITDTLARIARKELALEPLSADEIDFMHRIYFEGEWGFGCVVTPPDLDGWYLQLLYGPSYIPAPLDGPFSDYLVVDYHTTPTDCWGNIVGWISHAGTGPIDLAAVTALLPDGNTVAFVGPVMSYHEYTTTGFQRLTDEEWENTFLSQATRPAWTSSFLADESGLPY